MHRNSEKESRILLNKLSRKSYAFKSKLITTLASEKSPFLSLFADVAA